MYIFFLSKLHFITEALFFRLNNALIKMSKQNIGSVNAWIHSLADRKDMVVWIPSKRGIYHTYIYWNKKGRICQQTQGQEHDAFVNKQKENEVYTYQREKD